MIQAFRDYLERQDISSSFINDEHTLLTFDVDDVHYLFYYRRDLDPSYIRIMIPNIASTDINDAQVVTDLFNFSQGYKVGKAIIENNQLWLTAESFVFTQENVDRLFNRLLAVLRDMLNEYRRAHNG